MLKPRPDILSASHASADLYRKDDIIVIYKVKLPHLLHKPYTDTIFVIFQR